MYLLFFGSCRGSFELLELLEFYLVDLRAAEVQSSASVLYLVDC